MSTFFKCSNITSTVLAFASQLACLNILCADFDEFGRDSYCGERAAQAVLSWYGKEINLETIIKTNRSSREGTPLYGASLEAIQSTLAEHDIITVPIEINSSALLSVIAAWNRPAVIHLASDSYPKGHFLAVTPGKVIDHLFITGIRDSDDGAWNVVDESFTGIVLLTSDKLITRDDVRHAIAADSSIMLRDSKYYFGVLLGICLVTFMLWRSFRNDIVHHFRKGKSTCSETS